MNQPDLNSRPARRRLLLILLLLLLTGLGFFLLRPATAPPTIILPLTANVPKNKLPWLDRLVPYSWSWFWRLKLRIFGPTRNVLIQATIFEFGDSPALTNLLRGGIELANTNGIRALSFTPNELKNLNDRLIKPSPSESPYNLLSRPRIQTGDGVEATLSISGNGSSIEVGTFPRFHSDAVDLTTTLRLTETISATNSSITQTKTNLALWTKARIPDASGLLLLDCHPSSATNTKHLAILISANLPPQKK